MFVGSKPMIRVFWVKTLISMPVGSSGVEPTFGSYSHLIRRSTGLQVKDSELCTCTFIPPVNLVTSTQFSDDTKTIPDVEHNRQKQKSNTMKATLLSPNTGTNNTYPT